MIGIPAGASADPPIDQVAVDRAFDVCEAITRSQAKNFAYGIRLLRRPERRALSAVYALARRIDDIGDGDGPVGDRLQGLGRVRADVTAIARGVLPAADDPVLVAVHRASQQFPLPVDAFTELVAGCEMDVTGTSYETFDELVGYCRHVAGTIGRLSLGVFGTGERARATALADDLGVALQLTNILRDIVEDQAMGRVYLPAADADAYGLGPDLRGPAEALAALVALEAERADAWYQRGLQLLPLLDGRSRACVGAMAGIYRRLLDNIRRDPLAVTRGRLSVPPRTKAWVAVRSLGGVAS